MAKPANIASQYGKTVIKELESVCHKKTNIP